MDMHKSMRELREIMARLLVSLSLFLIIVSIYKHSDPYAYPGLENKILYTLAPASIVILCLHLSDSDLCKRLLGVGRATGGMWDNRYAGVCDDPWQRAPSPVRMVASLCVQYGFIVLLLIVVIQSVAPETIPEWINAHLMLTTVLLGVVTFYLNRDKLANLEEGAEQEEIAGRRRDAKFAERYPRVNRVWGVRRVARWVDKEGWWYSGALIGITVLALLLRLNQISTLDYWTDEFYSMITAKSVLDGTFPALPSGAINHRATIYFYFLAGSIKLFGFNQFAGRFLNLMFTCLIIYALYLMGRNLFERSAGIVAAFLFSISPLAIQVAREIRMYEMTAFLSIVIVGLGYAYMDKFNKFGIHAKDFFCYKSNIIYIVLYALLWLLIFDTHISTIAFVFSLYIYFLYSYYVNHYKQYKLFIIAGMVSLPFLIMVAYKSLNIVEGFLYLIKTGLGLQRPMWALEYDPLDWHILNLIDNSGLAPLAYLGILCSILLTAYSISKKDRLIFLMFMIFIPLIPVSLSRLGVARYGYFLLPLFILYVSIGLATLYKFISLTILKTKYLNTIFILVAIGLIVSNIHIGYVASNDPPWAKTVNFERASEIIKDNCDGNTTLLFNFMATPLEAYGTKADYFFAEMRMDGFNKTDGSHKLLGTRYLKFGEFEEYVKQHHNIIVAIRPWPSDITPTTFVFLNQNMKRIGDRNTAIIIYYKE